MFMAPNYAMETRAAAISLHPLYRSTLPTFQYIAAISDVIECVGAIIHCDANRKDRLTRQRLALLWL